MTKMTTIPVNYNNIHAEIVELLNAARSTASQSVNAVMTATYWEIGRRIVQSEQAGEKRAEYVRAQTIRLFVPFGQKQGSGVHLKDQKTGRCTGGILTCEATACINDMLERESKRNAGGLPLGSTSS